MAVLIIAVLTYPLSYDVTFSDEVLCRHIDHLLHNQTKQRTNALIYKEIKATDELLKDFTVLVNGPPSAAPFVKPEPHVQEFKRITTKLLLV